MELELESWSRDLRGGKRNVGIGIGILELELDSWS